MSELPNFHNDRRVRLDLFEPAPDLSPAEAATVARFDNAPYPAEILREQIARAMSDADAIAADRGNELDWYWHLRGDKFYRLADALLAGPLARFTGGNQ